MNKETAGLILYFLPIVIFAIWNFRLHYLARKNKAAIEYEHEWRTRSVEDVREKVWDHYREKQAQFKEQDERFGQNVGALVRYLDLEHVYPTCNPLEFKKRTK